MFWYVAESLRRRMACNCKVDDFWPYINQVIMDGCCSKYKNTHNLYPIVNSQKMSLSWKWLHEFMIGKVSVSQNAGFTEMWTCSWCMIHIWACKFVMFLLWFKASFARLVIAYGWVSIDICLIVASDVSVLKTNGMVNKERDGQTGWDLCMLPFLSCFYWNILSWC